MRHGVSYPEDLDGSGTTEVSLTQQNIFLEGILSSSPVQEGLVMFAAVRWYSHSPLGKWQDGRLGLTVNE
jgi:hypothetical protein